MAVRWMVKVGYDQMYDASAFYDAAWSTLEEAARDKAKESQIRFVFDVNAPGVPLIREGMEVHAGWANGGAFLADPAPFGGFIMQVEGYTVGPTHYIECKVSSYYILFTRCSVIGWPTGADGAPTAGFPPGYSVREWFVGDGSATYPGVVRAHLPGVDYSGVAPVFDTLVWDATNRPGNPDPEFPLIGQWGFTDLDSVLGDLVGGIRAVWSGIEPVYFMDAVAAGSRVQPRFNLIDGADRTGPAVATFSTAPEAGEYYLE